MYLTQQEMNYSFSQLAQRAGIPASSASEPPSAYFPLAVRYADSAGDSETGEDEPRIIIHRVRRASLDALTNGSSVTMRWVETAELLPPGVSLPISKKLPIFFLNEGQEAVVANEGRFINFNFDLLAVVFFLLSRYEELNSPQRDKYGRFPAASSAACRYGFAEQPLVDELALVFRAWMQYLLPTWQPEKLKGDILLTHDIDFVRTLPNLRKILRALRKQSKTTGPGKAFQDVFTTLKNEKADLSSSIYMRSIRNICAHSRQNGLKSTFFFKASKPSFYDSGYQVDHPVLTALFSDLKTQGFEIGLHPGYYAFLDAELMKVEKLRLEAAFKQPVTRCRQHYLRFDAGRTWQAQQAAGFTHDYSMAFAEQIGFRCGTCHPYHPFDMLLQQEMEITEVPLIIMDSSLKDYMHLPVEAARAAILGLAEKCLNVEGLFTLLWHNASFFNDWQPWGDMYLSVLPALSKLF